MEAGKKWCILYTLVAFCFVQETAAKGYFDVKLMTYSHDCREDLSTSKCDPFFIFCMSKPNRRSSFSRSFCNYAYDKTSHFQDDSFINFQTVSNKRGVPVPWVFQFVDIGDTVMLSVKVTDHDSGFLFSDHDHMVSMYRNMTAKIYPSKAKARFQRYEIRKSGDTLVYEMRMYCALHYYGPKCMTRCSPRDDEGGHYTCEPQTGKKLCLKGWTGDDCSTDINECDLGFCYEGTCENLPGDYKCVCSVFYSGKNCSIDSNPCSMANCQNNATCLLDPTDLSYTCLCTNGWTGASCDIPENPCMSLPCLNGGTCIPGNNNTNFTCDCLNTYFGEVCDESIDLNSTDSNSSLQNTTNISADHSPDGITITTNLSSTTTTTTTSTSTTTPTTTTTEKSTTTEISSTTEPSTIAAIANDGQVGQSKAEQHNTASFQLWHGLILLIAVLAMIIVITFMFVRRWRSRKSFEANESLPPPTPAVVMYDQRNGHLAFENNMYHEANRCNMEREQSQQETSLPPPSPFDDEFFYPTKPDKCDFDLESETTAPAGAEGFAFDNNSFVKEKCKDVEAMSDKDSVEVSGLSRKPTERAESNPYQDFKTLSMQKEDNEDLEHSSPDEVFGDEENLYQELDEIAMRADKPPNVTVGSLSPLVPPPRLPNILPLDSPPTVPARSSTQNGEMSTPSTPDLEFEYEEPKELDDPVSNTYAEVNKSRFSMETNPIRGSYIWTDGQDAYGEHNQSAYDVPRSVQETTASLASSIYDSPRNSGMMRPESDTGSEYSVPSSLPIKTETMPFNYETTSNLWTSNSDKVTPDSGNPFHSDPWTPKDAFPANALEPEHIDSSPERMTSANSETNEINVESDRGINSATTIWNENNDEEADEMTSEDENEAEDIKHLKQEVMSTLDFVLLEHETKESSKA